MYNVGLGPVYEGAHYDGDGLLFTTDTSGHFDKLRVGLQGIITSAGRTIAFDRDFEGRVGDVSRSDWVHFVDAARPVLAELRAADRSGRF